MRVFDRLNTPKTVLIFLLAILAVNGYLLYHQQHRPTPTAQTEEGSTLSGEESSPQAPRLTGSEKTGSETSEPGELEEPSEGGIPHDETSEKTVSESETRKDNTSEENTFEENTSEESSPESTAKDSTRKSKKRAPSSGERESSRPTLDGLAGAVRSCDKDARGCVEDLVSKVAPEARYLGGRTDLSRGSRSMKTMYFEDPQIEECDFERERYAPEDGPGYTVVLIGRGSFERGSECIPKI